MPKTAAKTTANTNTVKTTTVKTQVKSPPVSTAPPAVDVVGGAVIVRNSSFPINPVYDAVVAELGDPTQHPVLSMRARAQARVAVEGGDVDSLVWLFDEEPRGEA